MTKCRRRNDEPPLWIPAFAGMTGGAMVGRSRWEVGLASDAPRNGLATLLTAPLDSGLLGNDEVGRRNDEVRRRHDELGRFPE